MAVQWHLALTSPLASMTCTQLGPKAAAAFPNLQRSDRPDRSRWSACNQFSTSRSEMFEHIGIDRIVHVDADSREACRQSYGIGFEQRIEIDELVFVTGVELVEQRALEFIRAEYCDSHWLAPSVNERRCRRRRPGSAP